MDNNEMLYEISLKYNTLKMYENTIEQMIKNEKNNGESFDKIVHEKNCVEKELLDLLKPSVEETTKSDNKFINEVEKSCKYKEMYSDDKDFFNSLKDNEKVIVGFVPTVKEEQERINKEIEGKKPTFADIQDKISNSQWISYSNFIVRIPKKLIDIDEWRVSHVDFEWIKPTFLSGKTNITGRINIAVNDFAEKRENNSYNILMSSVVDLLKKKKNIKKPNISIDVIDNCGELFYTMVLKGCNFVEAYPACFDYHSSNLRTIGLVFEFDDIVILAPNEKMLKEEDETTD